MDLENLSHLQDTSYDNDGYINSRISYLQSNLYRLRLSKSKLKAVTRTSTLLSGFAMVAMVELNIDFGQNETNNYNFLNNTYENVTTQIVEINSNKIPSWLLILYAIVTCLLVSTHMLALMISTCVLSQVEAEKFESNSDEYYKKHDDFLLQSPERTFHWYIEFSWLSSIVAGIFLFLIEIGLICFIKFYPLCKYSALAGVLTMLPFAFIFVLFTFVFYKRIAKFKLNSSKVYLKELKIDQV